jgi:hypothetical protein
MSERVDEIRQRLEAATPGPWKADATENDVPVVCVDGPIPGTATVLFEGDWAEQPDAELIAHAPDDLAFLLDEVTRLTFRLKNIAEAHGVAAAEALRFEARAALGGTDD